MNLSGYHLRGFEGDRAPVWSATVSQNWRITSALKEAMPSMLILRATIVREIAMEMKNPPHPGRIVRDECFSLLA
jgi:hypothetical protein